MLLPGSDVQIFPTVFSARRPFELCIGARIESEVFDMHFTTLFSAHQIAVRVMSLHLHNFVSALVSPLQTQLPPPSSL